MLLSVVAYPQSGPGDGIWEEFGDVPDTAGLFPGEDLIVLKNERVIRNDKLNAFTDYFEHDVVIKYGSIPISLDENYMQIYVRNERGARLTWQLQFGVPQERSLLSIRLRNRKPNGQVILLDEADTRYVMNQTSKSLDTDMDYSSLPVPGIDAGDVVEIYSCYYVAGAVKSDEIYFHQVYPTVLSSFTYEHSMDFEVSLMKYNFDRFDCKKFIPDDKKIKYEFYNLPGLYNQFGVISQMELPFVVFRIDSILIKTPYFQQYLVLSDPNWDTAIVKFAKELDDYAPDLTEASLKNPDNFYNQFDRRFPDATKAEQAWLWHTFLSDSISIRFFTEKEQKLSMEHWLQLRTADRSTIIAWYMHYFDHIGLDYTVYISRDLTSGYLDSNFVFTGQGMSIFFGFNDGEKEHFVFPPFENESYLLDEFPGSLRGSVAVGLTFGESGQEHKSFQVPFQGRDENWKNRILHTLVHDTDADSLIIDQKSYFKGDPAKSTRSWYDQFRRSHDPAEVLGNEMISESGGVRLLSFDIDWESKEIYHHSLTYRCDNFMSSHSDSTYSVCLKDISPLDIMHPIPVRQVFGYYNLHPYYNITRFYLEFEKPVEIVGSDTISDQFRNEFGSMHLSAYNVNENMVLVETYYSAEAGFLSPLNYNAIEELSDRTLKMQEKRLFFRYK